MSNQQQIGRWSSARRRAGRDSLRGLQAIRGFTLLEIVIAVAIFAVIASIIFPGLLQFLEMRERVDEKHHQVVALQKTFQFIANDLRFASNRLAKDEYGEPAKTTLSVNDDSLLELTAQYPDLSLDGLSVPRRVSWFLEDGVLYRVQSPVLDPDSDTRTMEQTMLEGIEDVEIKVTQIVDGRNEEDDKWEEQSRLPDLIDITVKMPEGLEYRRLITMLSNDKSLAASVTLNAQTAANNSGAEQGLEDLDQDSEGPEGQQQ
ncbi:MAG: type II secretion system protein GspJ [Pseudomonadota bacterium]